MSPLQKCFDHIVSLHFSKIGSHVLKRNEKASQFFKRTTTSWLRPFFLSSFSSFFLYEHELLNLHSIFSLLWIIACSGVLILPKVFNPNWHEAGHFSTSVVFGSDFVCWTFTKKFQTLEVKIDINRVNLTPWQAHWVL